MGEAIETYTPDLSSSHHSGTNDLIAIISQCGSLSADPLFTQPAITMVIKAAHISLLSEILWTGVCLEDSRSQYSPIRLLTQSAVRLTHL